MYHFLINTLPNPLGLPVNDLWEYAILAVIGIIAFSVGWKGSPFSVFGSILHWIVHFLAFLVLWAVAYALLAAAQWVIAHLLLVCGVAVMAMTAIFLASIYKLYFL